LKATDNHSRHALTFNKPSTTLPVFMERPSGLDSRRSSQKIEKLSQCTMEVSSFIRLPLCTELLEFKCRKLASLLTRILLYTLNASEQSKHLKLMSRLLPIFNQPLIASKESSTRALASISELLLGDYAKCLPLSSFENLSFH